MSIFCVGQAAYDITARVDEDIVPDQKYRLTTHTECPASTARVFVASGAHLPIWLPVSAKTLTEQ